MFNFSFAREFSAECYVGFDVRVEPVGDDSGVTPLYNENALVVVVPDDVAVGETLQSESAIDVVFEVLHGQLVSKVLVVELLRASLDSLEGFGGLGAGLEACGGRCEGLRLYRLVGEDVFGLAVHHDDVGDWQNVFFGSSADVGD